jgi:uncharacterized protein (TIGR02453 family)
MTQPRKKREAAEQEPQSFKRFGPKALQFFHDLASHQDRAWFQQHQSVYENEVQRPMAALVASLADELARRGVPLTGDPKRSMFRIHRDVRFSSDKSPYKTHAGAVLTRDGTKNCQGLLYIHVSPDGSFTASGFYHPEPEQLLALRTAMAASPGEFQQVERALQEARLTLGRNDALKRLPRGFEDVAAGPTAENLKLKSFVVQRVLSEESLGRPSLVREIADFAEAALPLLKFGWAALDARAETTTPSSSPRRRSRKDA